ncbi:MAG: type II toxin-antitoxin system Phd/YefM family antitoxin [Acidobacteriota bacterium]|nr:type II toxin-antitoxin system Phd/YefM family antitoxin [Acidobacteriota bacterium]
MKNKAKTISASEFKAKCLQILDELDAEGIVVEKRGKPIAKVIPVGPADNSGLIDSMKGIIKVSGDIFSTGVKWNAES